MKENWGVGLTGKIPTIFRYFLDSISIASRPLWGFWGVGLVFQSKGGDKRITRQYNPSVVLSEYHGKFNYNMRTLLIMVWSNLRHFSITNEILAMVVSALVFLLHPRREKIIGFITSK